MNTAQRNFDKEAATWDEQPRRVKLAEDVARAMLEAVKPDRNMDVLDFGCGTGLLTLRFQPMVRSITGVDSSEGMLDVLREKVASQGLANVELRRQALEKGDVLSGSYDLVVSSMTFHHLRDIVPVLTQFHQVLRPGGCVCVADLDPDDGQFHSNNEGVFHFGFPEAELRRAFTEAGFVDLRHSTAARLTKPVASGGEREFTVFLMTGRK